MVTLNFTLLIELILFLIFLWGTARFILRPVLESIDARQEAIAQDEESAEANEQAANELEETYSQRVSELHHKADATFQDARREATQAHLARIAAKREDSDKAIAEVQQDAADQIKSQRDTIRSSVPEVAELIARQLKSGGAS